MRMLAGLSLAASIFVSPVLAAPFTDPAADVGKAFGNTLLSTYPDGRQAELWLNADGTYSAEGRAHQHGGGRWKIKDGKLCMRQSDPFPLPFGYCTPLQDADVGASWEATAPTGEPVSVTLIAGRPAEAGSDRRAAN